MGFFHDDWNLFRVNDLIPAAGRTAYYLTAYRDRPVNGITVWAMNEAGGNRPWLLTLMASALVAVAAISLYLFLSRVTELVSRDRLAAAVGTAAWIAVPWGLGYSLWPIGATTLVAMAAFLSSSILMVEFMAKGGGGRLALAAGLLAISFATYQAWYLGFVPVVLLALVLGPSDRGFRMRGAVAFAVGLAVQVAAVLHALSTTPKSTSTDVALILRNASSGIVTAVAAPFGKLWFVPVGILVVLALEWVRGRRGVANGPRRTARNALLACGVGVIGGTLPYSVAHYPLAGIGVFSRTTLGVSLWTAVMLSMAVMGTRAWTIDARHRFVGWSGLLVAVLAIASAVQMTAWAGSWRRQGEILAGVPYAVIARLPRDAVVLLDEPVSIRGVEVFAAPWDVSSAVYAQPPMRGIAPEARIMISPIYPDGRMSWDGHELVVRPGWTVKAAQLWRYRPGGELVRIEAPGRIAPSRR
jgi:hypothetical protein